MGISMDMSIPSYRRAKPVSRQDLERLKRGGEKADQIKQRKEKHHQEKELPEAEKMMEESLHKLNSHSRS